MTKNELKVLKFVRNFIAQNTYSPSYEEIAQGCGYSISSSANAYRICKQLIKKGYLSKEEGKWRNLVVANGKI